MPTAVVILPTNTYRASDFIEAAEALDVDLIVASEGPPPLEMGDRYVRIDCSDPEDAARRIVSFGDTTPIDAVIAADDQGVLAAARAAEQLGLIGNPFASAIATRDKLILRNLLETAEVEQPKFVAVGPEDGMDDLPDRLGLPLVLKPLDRSASQGVIRVDDPDDLAPTAGRIRALVGGDAVLLAESYLPGAEIAIEGMVRDGVLRVLAVFDKPDTSSGPYFPETLFITPSRLGEEALAEATRVAGAAITALGLRAGPVHVELRVDGTRAGIIEVASRSIGGLCSRSLNFGLMGTTLETLILRNAFGLDKDSLRRETVASGVLMIPTPGSGVLASIEGEAAVRAIPGITGLDFTTVPGSRVLAPPEGERYLGFVYARAGTPELVEKALREAMRKLDVQLEG